MSGNLGDIIDATSAPDATAIIDFDGKTPPRATTYRQLNTIANGVAGGLLASGLARGDRVAILSPNHSEYLATVLGIQRAGMVAVPVNFGFPENLVEFVLMDSEAKMVFVHPERKEVGSDIARSVIYFDEGPIGFDRFLDASDFRPAELPLDDPALLLYTSGSTGKPKGVLLSHGSHLWVLRTRLADVCLSGERFLVAAPLFHMNGLSMSQLALAGGASLVLMPRFRAGTYIAAIDQTRPTWITAVPPMFAMMLREEDTLRQADLSSVSTIRMGSAPVSSALVTSIRELLPRATIINGYGTTESGPVAFAPHPGGRETPIGSVGTPHPDVSIRLRDGADTNATMGVLEIRSPAAMSGYHNRPDIPNPFTEDGYYVTGDVFRRDEEEFYYFLGRTDDMFISGGENIFPSEVERIIQTFPAVQEVCVVPIPDEIKGHKPVAFVVPKKGRLVDPPEIQRHVLENAPAYQHPRHVWVVDSIPLTSTNKPDRETLVKEAQRLIQIPG